MYCKWRRKNCLKKTVVLKVNCSLTKNPVYVLLISWKYPVLKQKQLSIFPLQKKAELIAAVNKCPTNSKFLMNVMWCKLCSNQKSAPKRAICHGFVDGTDLMWLMASWAPLIHSRGPRCFWNKDEFNQPVGESEKLVLSFKWHILIHVTWISAVTQFMAKHTVNWTLLAAAQLIFYQNVIKAALTVSANAHTSNKQLQQSEIMFTLLGLKDLMLVSLSDLMGQVETILRMTVI